MRLGVPTLAAAILILPVLAPSGAAAQATLDQLDAKLDAMVVPFKVVDRQGGLCNSAAAAAANPEIVIDSDGFGGNFVVTSVMIRAAYPGVPPTGFEFFSVISVAINGDRFDTRTGNILGRVGGWGVWESADIMGMPVRRSSDRTDPTRGGNFPHQIVARSNGPAEEVRIRFFCRSDDEDMHIDRVLVAGWKRPGDDITVTYLPGH